MLMISVPAVENDYPKFSAAMVLNGDPETRWATPKGTKQACVR